MDVGACGDIWKQTNAKVIKQESKKQELVVKMYYYRVHGGAIE
jgi:hypothetical protein